MSDQHLATRHHTCRKKHQKPCIWCGEPIIKGDRWTQNTSVCDGELCSMNMHEECHTAFNAEFQHYWAGSFLGVEYYANDRGQPAKEGTIHEC